MEQKNVYIFVRIYTHRRTNCANISNFEIDIRNSALSVLISLFISFIFLYF